MMQLIREYETKIKECKTEINECLNKQRELYNTEYFSRHTYRDLGTKVQELQIKLEVYKEVYDRLVAYFTVNA